MYSMLRLAYIKCPPCPRVGKERDFVNFQLFNTTLLVWLPSNYFVALLDFSSNTVKNAKLVNLDG